MHTGLGYCKLSPLTLLLTHFLSFAQYIGIWDQTTGVKISIEFVSNNYTGALFPTITTSSKLIWENAASIIITNPINEAIWTNSRHIASTTGFTYTSLIHYIQQNIHLFTIYQPITILQANLGQLISGGFDPNNVIITPINSYYFIEKMISQLAYLGCVVESLITVSGVWYIIYV